MLDQARDTRFSFAKEDVEQARDLLEQVYDDETDFPQSPITADLVKLNLDHTERVRNNAAAIAAGEGLDPHLLEVAALLHDISKLDHRDTSSGGIDTWHHHHRGASLARKLVMVDLRKSAELAETVAGMIDVHSDIPFIRKFWERNYRTAVPSPSTPEELALRDADAIDLLWLGGMSKIVHFRQLPGSEFYLEDGGDIHKAIASAKVSFQETGSVFSTNTAKKMAKRRIETMHSFFASMDDVRTLQDFVTLCERFMQEDKNPVLW